MTVKAHTVQHLSAMHADLAVAIGERTTGEEDSPTLIRSLSFFRREQPAEPCTCMVEPSIVFVVQGAKQLLVGEQS
ncbi:AraC family transcriptional regulator N-terminal domain-containing protein, partial [Pokkaliibacter plantistimulans]|uniref:AraC family transcriptional regulator N-terminal domain-containing protein n=1 Tax=Pokkaliibacter plantistimulans TaxID=1635171 RepID=UPI002D79F17D